MIVFTPTKTGFIYTYQNETGTITKGKNGFTVNIPGKPDWHIAIQAYGHPASNAFDLVSYHYEAPYHNP